MKNYKESELILNEYAVPTHFHDMNVVNMKFSKDNIIIRFTLTKYLDDFNILDDENHLAILEVNYNQINIKEIDLDGVIHFRDLNVLRLTDINDIIELNLYDDSYDCYFNISFDSKSYNWKVVDVITYEDYYAFTKKLDKYTDSLFEIQNYNDPDWSKI